MISFTSMITLGSGVIVRAVTSVITCHMGPLFVGPIFSTFCVTSVLLSGDDALEALPPVGIADVQLCGGSAELARDRRLGSSTL